MPFRNTFSNKPLHLVRRKTFLGFPVYEKHRNDDRLLRLFAGGILSEDVRFNSAGECCREMRLFGHTLWQRTVQDETLIVRFGSSWPVLRTSIPSVLDRELERLFATVPVVADSETGLKRVIVFWANSGEIAMLLSVFMRRLLNRMGVLGSGGVVFLCTKPYHADMARLFFPDIPAIVAKPAILRHVTGDVRTLHWDVKVCFTGRYFCEFEQQARRARGEALDALDWMAKEFGLSVFPQQLSFAVTHRLDELEHVVDAKSGEFRIDWEKTILVCPGSFSCGMLSAEDMVLIQRMAKERGFFVIVNCDVGKNRLSMPELLSKARHAAGIIGIRSGLMDLLVMAKVPMLVFYRDFPDRGFNTPACPAKSVLRMFSLRRKENKDFVTESILNPAVKSEIVREWMNDLNGMRDHKNVI